MARRPARSIAPLPTVLVLALAVVGCGTGSSIPDSKIVGALDLKQAASGYEMGGDPFCAIDQLLNDSDEVDEASGNAKDFVIAGPHREVGVLAERPFAPDCAKKAKGALARLERKSP